MRILHAISALSEGGAERQLTYLAPELVRIGHQVEVVYLYDRQSATARLLKDQGVTMHQLHTSSNLNPRLILDLVKLLRATKPDILQSWSIQMDVLAGIAARLTNTPFILREPNSSDCYDSSWRNKLRLFIGRHSEGIVSNSGGGDEYWRPLIPSERRFVIHNGFPLERVSQAHLPSLSEFDLDPACRFILFVGRLEPGKNVERLIEALSTVQAVEDVHLVICGQGSSRETLEGLSASLGLMNQVHFLGYLRSDLIWGLMKRASAFVFMSRFEGMPNVVVEAMVCNTPLVVSDITAHRELLDESMAILVDPDNTDRIADAIVAVLQESEKAKERAAAAHAKAQRLSIEFMANAYETMYSRTVTRRNSTAKRSS